MGVGVYTSDFHGTGGTFLVSGPLAKDDDFESYLKAVEEDHPEIVIDQAADEAWNFRLADTVIEQGDHYWKEGVFDTRDQAFRAACEKHGIALMDKEEWGQDEYNGDNLRMIEVIEAAGEELGMSVAERREFQADRASFDGEFVRILDSKMVEVGWRSWEIDFVVGVGPSRQWKEWVESPDGYAQDILHETGRPSEVVAADYGKLTAAVEDYVRVALLENGIECRFRTSGYTSAAYGLPENLDEVKEGLKKTVADIVAKYEVSPRDALLQASPEDRAALIKALEREFMDSRYGIDRGEYKLQVPFYTKSGPEILWFQVFTDSDEENVVVAATVVPDEIKDVLAAAEPNGSGLVPLEREGAVAEWLAAYQAKPAPGRDRTVIATASEVKAAINRDVDEYADTSDGAAPAEGGMRG